MPIKPAGVTVPISLLDLPVAVVELGREQIRLIGANPAWALDPDLARLIPPEPPVASDADSAAGVWLGSRLLELAPDADAASLLLDASPLLDGAGPCTLRICRLDGPGGHSLLISAAPPSSPPLTSYSSGLAQAPPLLPDRAEFGPPTRSRSRHELDQALELASDGYWDWDLEHGRVTCSQRLHELLGYANGALNGSIDSWLARLHGSDRDDVRYALGLFAAQQRPTFEGELRIRREDGSWHWVLVRGRIVEHGLYGRPTRIIGTCLDIHRVKQASEAIHRVATRDSLTGLANRHSFHEELTLACSRVRRTGRGFTLMLMDLDRFKQVNDLMGHGAGDQLLQDVARRLRACFRPHDVVARLGGDEFAIITAGEPPAPDVGAMASRVVRALAEPFAIEHASVRTGASIGITVCPQDGDDPQLLLGNADMALYAAKAAGRGRWCRFSRELQESARQRATVEGDLRRAIERQELVLHFQPIVGLDDLAFAGVEVLLRWYHPQRGVLGPGAFLDAAERAGLMPAISFWVINGAIEQLRAWRDAGVDVPVLHVNLAASLLLQNDWLDGLLHRLKGQGIEPDALALEIVEGELTDDQVAADTLQQLARSGVHLAIDDFGTGHSSMARLRDLPFDTIKLDRSFLAGATDDSKSNAVVECLLDLSRRLHLDCIAEGIETVEQLELLRRLGCRVGQGYLFARPLPPAELPGWVEGWRRRPIVPPALGTLHAA